MSTTEHLSPGTASQADRPHATPGTGPSAGATSRPDGTWGADGERSRTLRATGVLLAGHLVRVAVQGSLFVVLARELGPASFGAYAAIAAVSAILLPFTGLGRSFLMMRDVVRDPGVTARAWRDTVGSTLLSGAVLVAAGTTLVLAARIADASALTVALLVLADTVGLRLVDSVGMLWQARGRATYVAVLPNVVNALRLAGLGALVLSDAGVSLAAYAWVNLVAVAVPAAVAVTATTRAFPALGPRAATGDRRALTGLTFALSGGAATVNNDVDKALLGALLSASAAGVYSAAYRVVDMAYVPVRALTAAVYPRYFHEGGAGGVRSALVVARQTVRWTVAYGVVGGLAVVLAAPALVSVLGAEYAAAEPVVRGLALVLLLRGVGIPAADALTGADRNGLRMTIQVATAALNVLLNVLLIPVWGIQGSVVATIVSESLFAIAVWASAVRCAARRRAPSASLPCQQEEVA